MRQWGSILLTFFMTLWLGVIVPGHQRGQIVLGSRPTQAMSAATSDQQRRTVAGDGSSMVAGESCCRSIEDEVAGGTDAQAASSNTKSSSAPKPRSGGMCAVCAFRLSLDVAVAFVLLLPDLGMVQLLDEHAPARPVSVCHVSPAMIRGPPAGIGLPV